MRRIAILICAPLLLVGCSDPAPVDPAVPAAEEQALPPQDTVPEEMADEMPEEVVIEVEPELESAAPMDTGLPMADAASTETEFSGDSGPDPVE